MFRLSWKGIQFPGWDTKSSDPSCLAQTRSGADSAASKWSGKRLLFLRSWGYATPNANHQFIAGIRLRPVFGLGHMPHFQFKAGHKPATMMFYFIPHDSCHKCNVWWVPGRLQNSQQFGGKDIPVGCWRMIDQELDFYYRNLLHPCAIRVGVLIFPVLLLIFH